MGPGLICNQSLDSPDNLDFDIEAEYQSYLTAHSLEPYGSDIDTINFWGDLPHMIRILLIRLKIIKRNY